MVWYGMRYVVHKVRLLGTRVQICDGGERTRQVFAAGWIAAEQARVGDVGVHDV